jgi:hypothetical protein
MSALPVLLRDVRELVESCSGFGRLLSDSASSYGPRGVRVCGCGLRVWSRRILLGLERSSWPRSSACPRQDVNSY